MKKQILLCLTFSLVLPFVANARASAWACGDVRPPEVGFCAKHGDEVRAYYNRCIKPRVNAIAGSNVAKALVYNSYLKMFDRELNLLTRLVPSNSFADEWGAIVDRWQKRMADHPELAAFDESVHVEKEFRGGMAHRLASVAPLRENLKAPSRDAGLGLLSAALLIQTSRKDRNRMYSLYPELVKSSGAELTAAFFKVTNKNILELRALVKEEKTLAARLAKVNAFVDDNLRAIGADADRLVTAADQTLRIEYDAVVSRIELLVDKVEKRPASSLKQDVLVTSARATIESSDALLNQDLWAAQCVAWHQDRKWDRLERSNEKYLFPPLSYSAWVMVASLVGVKGTETLLRALKEKPSKGLAAALSFGKTAGTVNNAVGIPLWIASAAISLHDVSRKEARARRDFYLSPVPVAGASDSEIKHLRSSRRMAIFNAILSVIPAIPLFSSILF